MIAEKWKRGIAIGVILAFPYACGQGCWLGREKGVGKVILDRLTKRKDVILTDS